MPTPIQHVANAVKGKHAIWAYQCTCGGTFIARRSHVAQGRITSCGCRQKEHPNATKHGFRHIPEYEIWKNIKARCLNQNVPAYLNYGGRGITICDEWKDDFPVFLAHVGYRPSPELTLDRINNDRGYEPGNMRWTTRKEQSRNRRPGRLWRRAVA